MIKEPKLGEVLLAGVLEPCAKRRSDTVAHVLIALFVGFLFGVLAGIAI